MSSNLIDKENSSTVGFGSKAYAKPFPVKSENSTASANKINSTPCQQTPFKNDHLINTKELTNTAGKTRKALGDLMNTALRSKAGVTQMGVTPKFDRKLNLNFHTPQLKGTPKLSTAPNKLQTNNVDVPKLASASDADLEPIEHCNTYKYDSFDDLFEEGRLTDLFLKNKNVTFVSRLPSGCHLADMEDRIKPLEMDDDQVPSLKQMNKLMKKQAKKMMKLTPHELPVLEEPQLEHILELLEI